MKISKRLKCIADMIEPGSNVIDVGCDHGFLDIYLTLNKNCCCVASDISCNVLESTKSNIQKFGLLDKIEIVCSDGVRNININSNDLIVISGMGTNTIINILKDEKIKCVEKIIIQSNNEIEKLRRDVIKLGYYIYDEKVVLDNNKDYVIICFVKGKRRYFSYDYLFGPIARCDVENINYFEKMYSKNKKILNKLPNKYVLKKFKQKLYLKKIKKFTCIGH